MKVTPPPPQLRATPYRPAFAPIEQRRADLDRVAGMSGSVMHVWGFILLDGAGEAVINVKFPVNFIELPAPTFGASLVENQTIEDGNFPTVSGFVKSWEFIELDELKNRRYFGADLVAVVTGKAKMKSIFCWHMFGLALNNPLYGQGGLDGSVDRPI